MAETSPVMDPEAASGPAEALPGRPAEPGDAEARHARGKPSRLGPLRHHHFRNVWIGALISNIGSWMEGIGVQWIMAEMTASPEWKAANLPSAPVMMGYLAAAQLGPTLVLGIPGGLVADRVNRKRLLIATQAAMMVIAGMLATASYLGHASARVLLCLSVLQGITVAFNAPAWQVLTPRLVPRAELTEAIALNGLQFNLARVVGPALGGALMAAYSPTVLFVINTLSFLGVLAAIWTTPDAPAPKHNGASPWKRTAEACSFVFRNRGPRAVFVALVTFSILAAPLMRMLPLYAHDVYRRGDPLYDFVVQFTSPSGAGEFVFGLLLALMGAGAVIGAVLIRRIPAWYPKHHFIPLAILCAGVTITVFSSLHALTFAAPILLLAGIFWLWAFNSALAAMQLLVPDHMRGRVMAVCYTPVFGAMPLGALIAGGIGDALTPHFTATLGSHAAGATAGMQAGVGVLGATLVIAGLVMVTWRTPEVDGLRPGEPGFDRRPGLLSGLTARAHRPRRPSPQQAAPASSRPPRPEPGRGAPAAASRPAAP